MLNLFKALIVVALLAIPLVIVTSLPRFFELAGSVPALAGQKAASTPTPGLRLTDVSTPTAARQRFAPLDETPPPTLVPPTLSAAVAASPRPTGTGERIVIGNTEGAGAVLRADPVTGRPVATLHEQQVFDVLERRNIPGSGDWVRVRTPEGVEGWVTGLVALPVAASNR